MTSKEYLRQAYRLDQIINSDIEEAARLREMTETLSSPVLCERIQTAHSGNAPFVSSLEKIMLLEEKINKEIDTLVDLKEQMRGVIAAVSDPNERLVLRYRYVHCMTWREIGNAMNADSRTIRRWHSNALLHVVVPEDTVVI